MAQPTVPDLSDLGELSVLGSNGHNSPSEVMYPGGPSVDGAPLAPGDYIVEMSGTSKGTAHTVLTAIRVVK